MMGSSLGTSVLLTTGVTSAPSASLSLANQRLPDDLGAVEQVNRDRPEPDAGRAPGRSRSLEQGERVAAELQGVPEHTPAARHLRDVASDSLGSYGHLRHPSRGQQFKCEHLLSLTHAVYCLHESG